MNFGLLYEKKKNLTEEERKQSVLSEAYSEQQGDRWTFVGVLPDTGFVQAIHHSKRTLANATLFLEKIKHKSDGKAPLFISDGWFYEEAISNTYCHYEEQTYGGRGRRRLPKKVIDKNLKYAQVIKKRNSKGTLLSVTRKCVIGDEKEILKIIQKNGRSKVINTSFVESRNGKYRKDDVRLARKTMCHSKKILYHDSHINLLTVIFNYCRENTALKEVINPNAKRFKQKYKKKSPAMAEGLCDKILTLKEVLFYRVPKNIIL